MAAAIAGLIGALALGSPVFAQSATWLTTPTVAGPVGGTLDFNANANWNPATAPGSVTQTGTATFGASTGTNISFSATDSILDGFTFNAGASNYSFTLSGGTNRNTLVFNSVGIVVNGGSASFTNNGGGASQQAIITFNLGSSAGNATFTNNSNGITEFGDTSTAGSATITNNNGITRFGSSPGGPDTATAANATITNINGGATTFSASTTAGRATITNTGGFTLFISKSTAGNANITNNNGGITEFTSGTSTAGNAIITNNAGGSTLFLSNSTAGNANITNNNGGITHFESGASTAGNAIITNNAGSTVIFDTGTNAGSATITNNNGGGLSFNNSTAASANIINKAGGLMQFSGTSTAGSATITNSGSVNFGDNSTGGNARLINSDPHATFNFSASTGPNGDGNISAGSIEGGGTVNLGNNQVTVGGNNLSTTFSGVITGVAAIGNVPIIKVGTGTLALTGNNTYTGPTFVLGGTLEVDGSIVSPAFAGPGATLSGTGTFGSGAGIGTGGTLAPGNAANPTGTLTIVGDLSFQPNAFYLVQVGASASQTRVTMATELGGTVQVAVTGGAQGMKSYDILHSNLGFLGGTTFAGVQSLTPGFTASLSETSTDVFLTLNASLGSGGGLNGNQQNIANAVNNAFNGGALPQGFFNLFSLSGASLTNALTQVSGETATGSQQTTFNAMSQFMGVMTDPFMGRGGSLTGSSAALGYAEEDGRLSAYAASGKSTDAFAMFTKAAPSTKTYEPRWSVWASGFGGSQSTDGNVALGSNNTTSSIAGTAVGADYLLSPNTLVGFALGGGGTNFSVANGGTGRSDLFQAGAYLFHTSGAAYVSAALAYGWQDVTTNRVVTAAGFDQLRTEFKANAFSGRAEGGYRFVVPTWGGGFGLTPYAAAQFVTFDLPAYAEQAIIGLNTFALSYGAHDVTDPRSELGFRADKSWLTTDGLLTLRGRLAWAHDYDPNRAIGATFQALPVASFVVSGAAQASDSVLTTASVETRWRNGWSAAATFEGEFSGVTRSYAGKGVVRYVW